MNLDTVHLAFEIIITIFIIYLTVIALKFAAKPRLKIRFVNREKEAEIPTGKVVTLKFCVENIGHWFTAKPAARRVVLYVNFESEFEPIEIRYGSALERSNKDVRIGKGGRKYMETEGIIYLYHEEPGEFVEVDVKTPEREGRYPIWIPARSEEGSCGFEKLWLKLVKD